MVLAFSCLEALSFWRGVYISTSLLGQFPASRPLSPVNQDNPVSVIAVIYSQRGTGASPSQTASSPGRGPSRQQHRFSAAAVIIQLSALPPWETDY